MSLIATPTLAALWRDANSGEGGEPEALSFWQHLLSKHVFREEYWICDAEARPEPGSRRRIDRGVRYVDSKGEIVVLLWLEAKGDMTPNKLREAEQQALDACKRTLNSHKQQSHIYALTTGKTLAKAWIYERDDRHLTALFGEQYIEANSSEGTQILKWFDRAKSLLPAAVGGNRGASQLTDTKPYANPLFPRTDSLNFSEIKEKYKQIRSAQRDPKNLGAMVIDRRSVGGWLPAENSTVMYCQREKLWMYTSDVSR